MDVFNREFRKNVKGLAKDTQALFLEYHWPGNIRELKNVIERAMILENEEFILPEHLPIEVCGDNSGGPEQREADVKLPAGGLDIEKVEKELIRQALDTTRGNQTKAAKLLNLTRDTLRYRMQKFGFLPDKE